MPKTGCLIGVLGILSVFLRKHCFEHVNTEGSHFYYRGYVDGQERLAFVP